ERYFGKKVDPGADPDHDGMTNWEESRAGTDPTDPNSVLRITQTLAGGKGKVLLRWPSVANQTYTLLRSPILSSNHGDYTVVEARIFATPPLNTYIDAAVNGSGPYFYRLRLE